MRYSLVALVLAVTGCPPTARITTAARSLTLFAGQPPGGGIDSEMRLVAQFYGRHIPGEPNIVPRNMPGAGGLILGNHLVQRRPARRAHARHAGPLRLCAGADHQRRRHQIRSAQVHLDRQLGLEQFRAVDERGGPRSGASTSSRTPSARSSSPARAPPRRTRSSRRCWRNTRACRSRWCAAIPASPTRCWRWSAARPTACCASAPASAPTCWRRARWCRSCSSTTWSRSVPLLMDLHQQCAGKSAARTADGAAKARPRRHRAARHSGRTDARAARTPI